MVEGFRLYFLVYYGLGIVVALITVATDYLRSAPVGQRPEGAGRHLLPLLVLVMLLLPPSLIFVRAGEIEAEWVPVRILGVATMLGIGCYVWRLNRSPKVPASDHRMELANGGAAP